MAKRQASSTSDPISSRRPKQKVGFLYLRSLDTPFTSRTTNSPSTLLCLTSDRLHTIGRKHHNRNNLVFDDPRVSKRHCQIFFHALHRKVYILDGFLLPHSSDDIKTIFRQPGSRVRVRPSLNGVFVNGIRVPEGEVAELCTGDRVHFVCANELGSCFNMNIGFVLEKIVYRHEEVLCFNLGKGNVSLYDEDRNDLRMHAGFLLDQCRGVLRSEDPISYICRCLQLRGPKEVGSIEKCCPSSSEALPGAQHNKLHGITSNDVMYSIKLKGTIDMPLEVNSFLASSSTDTSKQKDRNGVCIRNGIQDSTYKGLSSNTFEKTNKTDNDVGFNRDLKILNSSSGKKFYLNRLDYRDNRLVDESMVVSLPELLHPVESLSRMFIATFTSDILWFLSYCKVPNNLPVTIACHNTERCWSSSPDKRILTPYEHFPNLVVIYPPFPEVIAFGQDRKKQGIACHHPKLLVLQRENSIRVVVTSANLVSKQWNDVTNTVWWQDFPLRSVPTFSSLFTSTDEESFEGKSDFAAQLSGFMASLLVDVPSQAHWIVELTKYEYGGANGHLVASVPGMHRHRTSYPLEAMHFLSGDHCASRLFGMKFLGSVEASLVGLKHRFHTAADSNGAALKTLAAFVGKCQEDAFGMSEAVLRRNHNIPADTNAVSVLICDLDEFSEGDYIQLGFLPRNTAKWVASLCDAGFFSFSGSIYPKEVLAAALEGSNNKVQLKLYVSQGPRFSEMSSLLQPDHVASICSLIASLHRCVGLTRLHEVLGRYKWPELLETDFVYGSSSIGTSINPQFLAAFSSATGKRSVQFSESEDSDPEWGRWNANEELKKPSMRIIFPTIQRVRNSASGIWPYRRLLCLSEGTWQRLRSANIFHDAVPQPSCRVGFPMHTKVARRRFQSKMDASSFGWVYCGSHNFSPAAWGRPTSSSGSKAGVAETNYFLGSRLHICNYELGIVFVVPPLDSSKEVSRKSTCIDDITLPFVLPPPKYRPFDRPATARAMREAVGELAELAKEIDNEEEILEEMIDEIPDEEEMVEVTEYVAEEREEEKVYAETLWSQVDSAES